MSSNLRNYLDTTLASAGDEIGVNSGGRGTCSQILNLTFAFYAAKIHRTGGFRLNIVSDDGSLRVRHLLSTHADRQGVDISFHVCNFVCLFVCLYGY